MNDKEKIIDFLEKVNKISKNKILINKNKIDEYNIPKIKEYCLSIKNKIIKDETFNEEIININNMMMKVVNKKINIDKKMGNIQEKIKQKEPIKEYIIEKDTLTVKSGEKNKRIVGFLGMDAKDYIKSTSIRFNENNEDKDFDEDFDEKINFNESFDDNEIDDETDNDNLDYNEMNFDLDENFDEDFDEDFNEDFDEYLDEYSDEDSDEDSDE